MNVVYGNSDGGHKVNAWEKNLPSRIKLAYLPSLAEVKLRLTAVGPSLKELKDEVQDQIENFKRYASKYIYGYDSDTLQFKIGELLKERSFTIGTAESCTGGYLSHLITSVPGSSHYYKGSIIAYDNNIKIIVYSKIII